MSRDYGGKQGWWTLMGPMVSDFGSTLSESTERWNISSTRVPLSYE